MSSFTTKTKEELEASMADKEIGPMKRHDVLSDINKKVSAKFEISPEDEGVYDSVNGTWWYHHTWGEKSDDKCIRKSVNTGQRWRLPTQREMMLVWILQTSLIRQGYPPFREEGYWTATESRYDAADDAAIGIFMHRSGNASGAATGRTKANQSPIRCIRDMY
ncbi:hypothetical protein [Parabacteroides gordonii]|uniref:hypothetical protein n=1 Tax=Parabacteroides gordonii TaxID=574930 RepID=UPI0026F1E369|nr:hypothetical protein [Parabacteroides gordonii]